MDKNKNFLVGVFNDHDVLIHGIETLRAKGVKIFEAYTPYPVHGLEHALGYKRSAMPVAAFCFGITGTLLAILMQTWMMGIDWPMIIGGKSYVAVPDFVPVTFEMTVLLAAFGMVGTFLFTRDLKPHKVPRIFDIRATDDKHIVAVDLAANSLTEEQIASLFKEVHAEEIYRKDFTDEENEGSFAKYLVDLFANGVTRTSRISTHR